MDVQCHLKAAGRHAPRVDINIHKLAIRHLLKLPNYKSLTLIFFFKTIQDCPSWFQCKVQLARRTWGFMLVCLDVIDGRSTCCSCHELLVTLHGRSKKWRDRKMAWRLNGWMSAQPTSELSQSRKRNAEHASDPARLTNKQFRSDLTLLFELFSFWKAGRKRKEAQPRSVNDWV